MSKPTLKSLIRAYILEAAQPREKDLDYPVDFKTWELEQQLAQLIADIIGEDDRDYSQDNTDEESKKFLVWTSEACNELRAEQRQRAKERGVEL